MSRRILTTHAPRRDDSPRGCRRWRPGNDSDDPIAGALRQAKVRLLDVRDVYEFDRSRWASGPRRATRLVYMTLAARCQLRLPESCRQATMAEDLNDLGDAWDEVLWASLEVEHRFRTREGLRDLDRKYCVSDVICRASGEGMQVECRVDMEAL